ncbi:SIR2 family protein [Photobacterium damselae]|uniref:SIR2 family protein n=1 Tax=Photobacterium damselae TaxID=38293 RepID=UPI001EE03843|nr:SIR2 family protein [Photobacterium damselae]MCG3823800.1 SIR2 family protein [Photobacterium damselae]
MKLPETLAKKLSQGRVIPLVGAGVSMSIKNAQGERVFPSWKTLLLNAAKKAAEENNNVAENAITLLVEMNELHTAAEMAKKYLPNIIWYDFLTEQFNPDLNQLDKTSAKLQRLIWNISNRIITLNYDKCLSWAHDSPASVILFDNSNSSNLRNFKANKSTEDMVWHLHGFIDHPENIVLTPESYKCLYASNKGGRNEAAITTLRDVFSTETILFIGSSLSDVELLEEMQKQDDLFANNTGPHYALVKESDSSVIKEKLTSISETIQILTFDDFGEPLENLLDSIVSNSLKNKKKLDAKTDQPNRQTECSTQSVTTNNISVLIANPLDYQFDYEPYLKSLKKFKAELILKPLNDETIWDDSDYIFILSKWTKNGLQIEDDSCCRDFLELNDLFDCLPIDAKGIFIIVDSIPENLRRKNLEELTNLPVVIFEIDKNNKSSLKKLDQLYHQIFKRKNFSYIENSIIANENNFNFDINISSTNKFINSSESKLHNIDKSTTINFVGRNSDISSISREITRIEDKELVLAIKGSGGIGKTTIINKLAIELSKRDKYNGGIYFIDCEPISDFNQFYHKLSSIFELQSAQYLIEHLNSFCDEKKRLIIIDNFESILNITGATEELKSKYLALIGELSQFASIVITTRESCGEPWEVEYTLRSLESDEAILLFNNTTKNRYSSPREQLYIKNNIIEEQLDRNPLAIKLVASNIPPGKSIYDLENDLQELFSSIDCLDYFNQSTDLNINRKNSLLGSVIYSYRTLNDIDQKALELISFFPDGISLNSLKKVAQSKHELNKNKKFKSLITDNSIKTLSNKSLIEDSSDNIKLHPIINRFVFIKANQNHTYDTYWQNIVDYNMLLVKLLDNMRRNKEKLSFDIALSNINNFFLTLEMGHKTNFDIIDPTEYLDYIDSLSTFCADLCLSLSFSDKASIFLEIVEREEIALPEFLLESIKLQLCFSLYYSGSFDNAFDMLQRLYPCEKIITVDRRKRHEYIDSIAAITIYSMEGYTNFDLEYLIKIQQESSRQYPSVFYEKCIFHTEYLNECDKDLSYYESHRLLNTINIDDLKSTIDSLHPNQHLVKCQLSYILHLVSPLSDSEISKLVSVNPFTSGLKYLMLAINEEKNAPERSSDTIQTLNNIESLYNKASKNLFHIKYFYVHCQYHHCKFLLKSGSLDKFNTIKDETLKLCKKYGYPFWIHEFENLASPKPYQFKINEDFSDYECDIIGFINRSLKKNRRNKTISTKAS